MRKLLSCIAFALLPLMTVADTLTLERCVELARANYPLVKKYELVERTEALSLSDINRGWLPKIGLYAQGTVQNVVPAFPDALGDVLDKMGQEVEGLSKLQWKVGIDVSQTIWDGGASKANREMQRAVAGQSRAALDVDIYAVGQRVQDLYFGILLMEEQIARNESTISLLESNRRKLLSMFENGTAMRSDADMVEAQLLTMRQRQTEARGALDSYQRLLELYIGEPVAGRELVRPSLELPADLSPDTPEQRLFDAREAVNRAQLAGISASLLPKIGFFAQGYYGYPGFDYFKSMMSREASLNLIAGVKVSWNIDSFYTKKNSERRVALSGEAIKAERETFLFNNRLKSEKELAQIDNLRKVISDDERIIALRTNVRKAAESQLLNGVIDTDALLSKITEENQARLTAAYHEIQQLQYISNLKHTLNR